MIHATAIVEEGAKLGNNTKVWHFAHVRKNSEVGENCILGKNTYVDAGVKIGNNVKLQNNVSVYDGVVIHDGVFVGPHVTFTNDLTPRAINIDGSLKLGSDWEVSKTIVKTGASIGAASVILPGITIGQFAMIGAGSTVTKNVQDYWLVYGAPAEHKGYVCKCGAKLGGLGLKGKVQCQRCKSEIEISP